MTDRWSFMKAKLSSTPLLPDGWQREQAGIAFEHVRGQRLAELQPGLSPRFVAGTFVPGWKTVSEPQAFALALWAHAQRCGATFEKAEIAGLERSEAGPSVRLADGTTRGADRIVICAGAWSTRLINPVTRLRIPLETERGYNTTLPKGAFDLKRQLIFGNHGFVITPLSKPASGSAARWNSAVSTCRPIMPARNPCLRRRQPFCPG
jgi:D-amino-acid dehydrogenase